MILGSCIICNLLPMTVNRAEEAIHAKSGEVMRWK